MGEFSLEVVAAFVVITTLAGFVQGSVGFGFAVVSVPTLSLLDPALAPVPQLAVQIPLTLAIYFRERQHADWSGVLFTTLGRLPGTLLGVWLLMLATQAVLDLTIGGIVLFAVLALVGGRAIPRTRLTEVVAGAFSGAGAVVSAIGGPPLALLYKEDSGPRVRATLSLIFAVGLVVTIFGRGASGAFTSTDMQLAGLALPSALVGFGLSQFATEWIEGPRLKKAILGISGVSAIALLARGAYLLWGTP